ncbi:MAG: hypothetical protein ACLS9K_13665 [Lachnospira eligens]
MSKFNGAADKGLILLPCELIADNGIELKKCIMKFIELWGLEDGFKDWVNNYCSFCPTLVDRIVPGYPEKTQLSFARNGDMRISLSTELKYSVSGL